MRGIVQPVRRMVVRPRVEEAFGFAEVQVLVFALTLYPHAGLHRERHSVFQR